ncbi:MAG: signal peptidase I [Patescibacteria group bacterium]|nr:MAG: signal peptidase I [Patescibacteria group bacterium]
MKTFLTHLAEFVKMAIIALAIILPIRYFIVQPFYVKGASMEPTFHDHEYLMVDEISYRFNEPKRGEVLVFRYPYNPKEYYIKRLIGLPGETILIQDGMVFITTEDNRQFLLKENYLPSDIYTVFSSIEPIRLSEDEYFVLGDNRNSSKDSRVFGPINSSHIIGRVFFRGWPLNRFGLLLEDDPYPQEESFGLNGL